MMIRGRRQGVPVWQLFRQVRRVLPFVRPHRRLALTSISMIGISALLGVAGPWPLAIVIDTITGRYDAARRFLDQLAAAGIDFDDVTEHLEHDGLAKFEKSWSELGATVAADSSTCASPTATARE